MKNKRLSLILVFAAMTSLAAGPATAQTGADEELCRYLSECGSLNCKIMEWILC